MSTEIENNLKRRVPNVDLRRTLNVDFWIFYFFGTGKTFCDVLGSNMVKLLQFVNKSI
jgi:hypothetical protein